MGDGLGPVVVDVYKRQEYSYADLERFAVASEPFQYFIDPDAPAFVPQGNIPRRVCLLYTSRCV